MEAYQFSDRSTAAWRAWPTFIFFSVWTGVVAGLVAWNLTVPGVADPGIGGRAIGLAFLIVGLLGLHAGWAGLHTPYEIYINEQHAARFVTVVGEENLRFEEVSRIVRRVAEEDGTLLGFELFHPRGSIRLPASELLLARFAFLCRKAFVVVHTESRSAD